jgi:putative transferase (TIGR04331 family)
MKMLKEVNIVFTDPHLAAEHINNVWFDIDKWWNSIEVINARNTFFDIALRINDNWKNEWLNVLH